MNSYMYPASRARRKSLRFFFPQYWRKRALFTRMGQQICDFSLQENGLPGQNAFQNRNMLDAVKAEVVKFPTGGSESRKFTSACQRDCSSRKLGPASQRLPTLLRKDKNRPRIQSIAALVALSNLMLNATTE
jgi:hypothetical protein